MEQDLQYVMDSLGVVIGAVMSLLADYIPNFNVLEPKYKRLVFVSASFIVPLFVFLFGYMAGVYEFIDFQTSIYPFLRSGFAVAVGGTVAHTRYLK